MFTDANTWKDPKSSNKAYVAEIYRWGLQQCVEAIRGDTIRRTFSDEQYTSECTFGRAIEACATYRIPPSSLLRYEEIINSIFFVDTKVISGPLSLPMSIYLKFRINLFKSYGALRYYDMMKFYFDNNANHPNKDNPEEYFQEFILIVNDIRNSNSPYLENK